jgi:hypothetical protein
MFADSYFLLPICPECSRPMRLVHVLTNAHVYPPVRTFECAGGQVLSSRTPPRNLARVREFDRSTGLVG